MLSLQQSKIVLRMPNWIGDLVMATPILEDIRTYAPQCHLIAIAKECDVLKNIPHIDQVLPFEKNNVPEADLGILLTNSFSSAWQLYRAGVPERVGYTTDFRSPLLTTKIALSDHHERQHLVTTYKELLHIFGIPVSDTKPKLYLTEGEREWAHNYLGCLGIQKPVLTIHPGAAYGSAKCWPPERFRALTQKLLTWHPGAHLLFVGTESQRELIHSITRGLSHRVHNLAGKTNIRQLMALIDASEVFVTNDSGPMHMAAALDVRVIALFGSTSATRTGPYRTGTVIQKPTECAPCYKRTCPIDFRCMRSISAEEVFQQVVKC